MSKITSILSDPTIGRIHYRKALEKYKVLSDEDIICMMHSELPDIICQTKDDRDREIFFRIYHMLNLLEERKWERIRLSMEEFDEKYETGLSR